MANRGNTYQDRINTPVYPDMSSAQWEKALNLKQRYGGSVLDSENRPTETGEQVDRTNDKVKAVDIELSGSAES